MNFQANQIVLLTVVVSIFIRTNEKEILVHYLIAGNNSYVINNWLLFC